MKGTEDEEPVLSPSTFSRPIVSIGLLREREAVPAPSATSDIDVGQRTEGMPRHTLGAVPEQPEGVLAVWELTVFGAGDWSNWLPFVAACCSLPSFEQLFP